jgi:chemotaxis protein MotB
VVSQLLPVLQQAGTHKIIVEGHTDNLPIQTVRFPSNWELAAGRAGSVVRHLHSRGIAAARMKAIGYADTAPLADNDTLAGRAANRRVEIILEAPATSR